ncbi:hypothetical protein ACWCXB_11845 [Streptomyces sp. NPDC001514]
MASGAVSPAHSRSRSWTTSEPPALSSALHAPPARLSRAKPLTSAPAPGKDTEASNCAETDVVIDMRQS